MRIQDIAKFLSPYSIHQKRSTTVKHAFASAEAPADAFSFAKIVEEFNGLYGGKIEDELKCIYCDKPAETWDHLVGLVKDGRYSGYGHRIRNLVPCCKSCNSSKGNKDWEIWLRSQAHRFEGVEDRITRIRRYADALSPDSESFVPAELR